MAFEQEVHVVSTKRLLRPIQGEYAYEVVFFIKTPTVEAASNCPKTVSVNIGESGQLRSPEEYKVMLIFDQEEWEKVRSKYFVGSVHNMKVTDGVVTIS